MDEEEIQKQDEENNINVLNTPKGESNPKKMTQKSPLFKNHQSQDDGGFSSGGNLIQDTSIEMHSNSNTKQNLNLYTSHENEEAKSDKVTKKRNRINSDSGNEEDIESDNASKHLLKKIKQTNTICLNEETDEKDYEEDDARGNEEAAKIDNIQNVHEGIGEIKLSNEENKELESTKESIEETIEAKSNEENLETELNEEHLNMKPNEGNVDAIPKTNEEIVNEKPNKVVEEKLPNVNEDKQSKKKKTKRIAVIDTDSEDETENNKLILADTEDSLNKNNDDIFPNELADDSNKDLTLNKFKSKRLAIIDSDTDEESEDKLKLSSDNISFNPKLLGIIDSESEQENEENNDTDKPKKKLLAIVDSDSECDENPTERKEEKVYCFNEKNEMVEDENNAALLKSRLANLCDSESEDERLNNEDEENTVNQPMHYKKKSTKKNEEKVKKMTTKEAMEQRKEIESESQRRVREKEVSLPYHRPKQRTLQEFLQNRPRFSAAIPIRATNTPVSMAIKMSAQQLELISKNLEEREKEVEEFFKSDSEAEDDEDDDDDYVPGDKMSGNKSGDEGNDLIKCNEDVGMKSIEENLDTKANKENPLDEANLGPKSIEESGEIKLSIEENKNHELNKEIEINSIEENIEAKSNEENFETEFNEEHLEMKPNEANLEVNPIKENSEEVNNMSLNKDCIDPEKNEEDRILDTSDNTSINKTNDACIENNEVDESQIIDKSENNEDAKTVAESGIVILENIIISPNKTLSKDSSLEYEFDLDDMEEEEEEQDGVTNKIDQIIKMFNDESDLMEKKERKLTKLELIKQKFGDLKPKLSGGPNLVIDLDEGVTKQDEIGQLMERFNKHTAKKTTTKHNLKFSILSVTGDGAIHKEDVAVKTVETETPPIIEKPGMQMKKLKIELEHQMAQRRAEMWKQKQNIQSENNEVDSVYDGEKSECSADEDNILDINDEEEFTESSEDEIEEDDDDDINEVKEKKNDLIDNEAEEDDEVDADAKVDEEDEDDNEGDEENENDEERDDDDIIESQIESIPENDSPKKKLKRIIQPVDDSDDESNDNVEGTIANGCNDTTVSWDDDCPTPAQRNSNRTPNRKISDVKSDMGFLSPVCHLTALQSLNSGSKFMHKSPSNSPTIVLAPEPSPLKGGWQKKLFSDMDVTSTQENLEDFESLCSGQFTTQKPLAESSEILQSQTTKHLEDLEDLCSGVFPSQTQKPFTSSSEICPTPATTQELLDICSGKFTGLTQNSSAQLETSSKNLQKYESIVLGSNTEIKNFDDDQDDKLISQLLDEQELEEFKKKFESPICADNQSQINPSLSIATRINFDLSDNDDDEDEDDVIGVKKHKRKVIVDSDDEDDVEEQNEVIDLHDDDDEEEEEDNDIDDEENDKVKEVDYDSEENEIEIDKSEAPKMKLKASDFFENEAELSESEWGSEDEDEKGLDKLDFELGDAEKFDENKVKSDLEKIHMRRLLDDDTRDVKMLQEMLLQDGELHGAGRQRQFRWKNIDTDNIENGEGGAVDENDALAIDDEDELEWRKKRYEREIYLRDKCSQDDDADITISTTSQVLKLGQKALIRSNQSILSNTAITKEDTSQPKMIQSSFLLANKRGSFLTRSDQMLAKVAEMTKINNSVIGGAKKSRNFVFQTLDVESSSGDVQKKRKAQGDGTPVAIKKLRLNSNTLSPAQTKTDSKNRAKKLFSTGGW